MSTARALVTGAGGFVCSQIALALADAGYEVIATDQHFDAQTAQRLSGVHCVEQPLQAALSGLVGTQLQVVVHGAAQTAPPEVLHQTAAAHLGCNTDLLTATLSHARAAGAQRFLFLSSMGVFAPDDQPQPSGRMVEATQPTGTIPYAIAKRAGEILTQGAQDDSMQTLSLRLGNTFGPFEAVRPSRQILCLVSRMIAAANANGAIDAPATGHAREWSWLPDLAAGIARLMGQFPDPACHVVHAGTPPILSAAALAQCIASQMSNVSVTLSDPSLVEALRPPMASDVPSVMNDIAWTPIEVAIQQILRSEVPA